MIYFIIFMLVFKINFNESFKRELERDLNILTKGTMNEKGFFSESDSTEEFCDFDERFPSIVHCKVTALDQDILNNWLENQQNLYGGPLSITLYKSTLLDNTFSKGDLSGDFSIDRLDLAFKELHEINDDAFDKPSMRTLEYLRIKSDGRFGVETMNERTFYGLQSLKDFYMSNYENSKDFIGDSMFKPFATTITRIEYTQHNREDSNGHNPGNWLNGENYPELKEFSCIVCYFPNTLNINSFAALISVEILTLAWCEISVLQDETFEPIMKTLRRLDLSDNKLKRLTPEFVNSLKGVSYRLFLEENQWICDCENEHLINAIKNNELNLYDQPVCETPDWVNGENLGDIKLNCDSYTTSSISTYSTTRPTTKTTNRIETSTKDESYETDDEHKIELICKLTDGEDVITKIKQQLMFFSITSNSEESVTLTFERKPVNIFLYYFTPKIIESGKYLKLEDEILSITELLVGETYIFCLTPSNENDLISPFDCRSHHMIEQNIIGNEKAWLTSKDKYIFILISIFGILVSLLIGFSTIFCVLRQRAALQSSKTIWDKESYSSSYEDYEESTNFYLKYYQRSQIPASKITISEDENLPPDKRAPAMPPFREIHVESLQFKKNHIYDSIYQKEKDNSNNEFEQYQRSRNFTLDFIKTSDETDSSPIEYAPKPHTSLQNGQLTVIAEIHDQYLSEELYQSLY